MAHLLRSRLIFSFFAATLVLFVVLLAASPTAPRTALASGPDGGPDALNVELVGTYDTSTLDRRASKVFVHEGHAYLVKNAFNSSDPAASRNAVDEVNISNPSSPQRNNTFGISNSGVTSGPGMGYTINDIFVRGPIAYLALTGESLYSTNGEFWSLNLATTPPTKICSFVFERGASSVVADANYAYVATGKTVQALNIAAPDANQQCGAGITYTLDGFVSDMVDVEDRLYLATSTGLEILGANHTIFPVSGGVSRLAVREGGLVAAAYNSGVHIIDASNPGNPRLLGTRPNSVNSVALDGSYLYLGSGGLRVVDISDPANPTEVGYYEDTWQNSSSVYDVFVTEGLIHTPDGIFRFALESCSQARGSQPCNPISFVARQPTVLVNNQPLAVGSSRPLNPQDRVTLNPPAGQGEVELTCRDVVMGMAQFFHAIDEGSTNPLLILLTLDYAELLRKHCNQSPPTSAQGTGPDLGFRLEQGTVRVGGEVPDLELNIGTTSATAQSTGVNLFTVAHLPDTGATTVRTLNGTVQVVPTNSALPPVTLQRNEQVTVTASEVSPVTPYGSSVFLPLTWR